MKLLLDMHISSAIAASLRSTGIDAFQLRDRGLQKMEDVDIVALAEAEDCIVVTRFEI